MATSSMSRELTMPQWVSVMSALTTDGNLMEGNLHEAVHRVQSADSRLRNMAEADLAGRLEQAGLLKAALEDAARLARALEERLDAHMAMARV